MTNGKDGRRVLVIGLDGGSFNVLDPLMQQGIMPNLQSIAQEGVRGTLKSTIPPVTGPAWVSFLTGKNPGKHGVFDFVKRAPGGPGREIVTVSDIKGHTLWTLLGHYGRKSGLLNVPVTYPPPAVDGFVVPGLLTPGKDPGFTYPSSVASELENLVDDYMIDVKWQHYDDGEEERLLTDLVTATQQKKEAALHLFRKFPWDLGVVVFEGPDRLQHALWSYFRPPDSASDSPRAKMIHEGIVDFYRALDSAIGDVKALADEKTTLIVMSDHGFGSLDSRFYINRWLKLRGWLTLKSGRGTAVRAKSVARWLIRRTGFTQKRFSEIKRKRMDRKNVYGFLHEIEWLRTRAYAASNTEQGIYLNVAGREPHGVISPGQEYLETREKLLDELRELKHPETGEPMVTELYKREDIYEGPFRELAPDIVFVLNDGSCLANVRLRNHLYEKMGDALGAGTHRYSGILMARGPDIRTGSEIDGASIIDVAPTILYLLGVPIPEDMDGGPLKNLFAGNRFEQEPPSFVEPPPLSQGSEAVLTDEEAEKVKDQLRGLGYLG